MCCVARTPTRQRTSRGAGSDARTSILQPRHRRAREHKRRRLDASSQLPGARGSVGPTAVRHSLYDAARRLKAKKRGCHVSACAAVLALLRPPWRLRSCRVRRCRRRAPRPRGARRAWLCRSARPWLRARLASSQSRRSAATTASTRSSPRAPTRRWRTCASTAGALAPHRPPAAPLSTREPWGVLSPPRLLLLRHTPGG